MLCINCGDTISGKYYWKLRNGVCTHTALCWDCRHTLKDCIPGEKVNKCINCGVVLGNHTPHAYGISWKRVDDVCKKVFICWTCRNVFESCEPTAKEEELYFGKQKPKKKKKKKRKKRRK